MTDDGWVPEARPVPEALTDTFKADPYTKPPIRYENDLIGDWASFVELVGPEGMAALAKAVL